MDSLANVMHQDKWVLLDFWADWCAPCKTMLPIMEQLREEMGERLDIVTVDIDEHLDWAVSMKVMGVPAFMLYKNGVAHWRDTGVFTKEALKQIIDTFVPACAS